MLVEHLLVFQMPIQREWRGMLNIAFLDIDGSDCSAYLELSLMLYQAIA